MFTLAQKFYGEEFAGLTIGPCDFITFSDWYNSHHTCLATPEKYEVAKWVWENYK